MSFFSAYNPIFLILIVISECLVNGTGIAIAHVYKFLTHMRTPHARNLRMDYCRLEESL